MNVSVLSSIGTPATIAYASTMFVAIMFSYAMFRSITSVCASTGILVPDAMPGTVITSGEFVSTMILHSGR